MNCRNNYCQTFHLPRTRFFHNLVLAVIGSGRNSASGLVRSNPIEIFFPVIPIPDVQANKRILIRLKNALMFFAQILPLIKTLENIFGMNLFWFKETVFAKTLNYYLFVLFRSVLNKNSSELYLLQTTNFSLSCFVYADITLIRGDLEWGYNDRFSFKILVETKSNMSLGVGGRVWAWSIPFVWNMCSRLPFPNLKFWLFGQKITFFQKIYGTP